MFLFWVLSLLLLLVLVSSLLFVFVSLVMLVLLICVVLVKIPQDYQPVLFMFTTTAPERGREVFLLEEIRPELAERHGQKLSSTTHGLIKTA